MTLPLPLETARCIARAAISSLDVSLRLDADAIAPTYSWVVVTLSSHQLTGHAGETLRRNIRESLRVLTALAACKGFAVKENATFWSDVWPEDPAYEQPQWAAKWKHLHLGGLPMPSTDRLKFIFRLWDGEVGGRSHADVMALVEELIGDTQESDSACFRLTMEILGRHIEQDKWPLQVECGVETTQEHANRWSRLVRAAKHREQAGLTKMWTQFQFTECFLSAQHCLERSGVLRDAAAVFQTQGGAIPVTELMLHFGWNSNERNWEKRLRELKALMWNVASASAHTLRVLQVTGRCLADAAFLGTLCSALPYMESMRELRVVLPPTIRSDMRICCGVGSPCLSFILNRGRRWSILIYRSVTCRPKTLGSCAIQSSDNGLLLRWNCLPKIQPGRIRRCQKAG